MKDDLISKIKRIAKEEGSNVIVNNANEVDDNFITILREEAFLNGIEIQTQTFIDLAERMKAGYETKDFDIKKDLLYIVSELDKFQADYEAGVEVTTTVDYKSNMIFKEGLEKIIKLFKY